MENPSPTGGDALVAALKANDVHDIFAIPGIQLDWAVDALSRNTDISVFMPRHEQSVTYMADGYARTLGKPGVGMVVPGPGMLNACAGLSTAYACNSPVVLLVGQIHSEAIGKGYGNLHEIPDQSGILSSLTKFNTLVKTRGDIGPAIGSAFAKAVSGRARPTSVEIPFNILMETAEGIGSNHFEPDPVRQPSPAEIDKAAALLDKADFPVIYVGGGAMDAHAEVAALAEKLSAPVIASDNGRGILPDSHHLSFTTLSGRPLIDKADVVLVLGSRFMEVMDTKPRWPQDGKTYIYVNVETSEFSAPRNGELCIQADATVTARQLTDAVSKRSGLSESQSLAVKQWAAAKIEKLGILWDYVRTLRAALPDDGILVNELTQVGYLSRVAFEVRAPRTLIGPGYQGTLGYSFPTALGAAVAGGGRRVFALSGDGGFGWSMQEVATAVKYDLPVTLILFNDGHYGNVRAIQQRTFGREYMTDLQNPDFGQLAQAFAMPYEKCDDLGGLAMALQNSVRSQGPTMIEVPVGKMPSPWPLLPLKPAPGMADDYADVL